MQEKKHVGFPVANRIVNATEAAALEKTGQHVFYNFDDIPKIARFMNRMVPSSQNLYLGHWEVQDHEEANRSGNILELAF